MSNSDTYQSLDYLAEHNPASWEEVVTKRTSKRDNDLLRSLPTIVIETEINEDFGVRTPQRFIALIGEHRYYFNTGGYSFRIRGGKPINGKASKEILVSRENFAKSVRENKELRNKLFTAQSILEQIKDLTKDYNNG